MSFIFTVRSTGSSTHRRDPASAGSLPAIPEDRNSFIHADARNPPAIPARAVGRGGPTTRIWAAGQAPPFPKSDSPPPYQFDDEGVVGPKGEKLSEVRRGVKNNLRNNKWVAKRGGWRRLALIALILIALAVGLGVGLGVGLHHKNNSNSSTSGSSSGSSGNSTANATFPAGTYMIDTVLNTVSTDCTNNSATWSCYPYTTYSQEPSSSEATFEWIISPVENSSNYTISSTDNYFSILFSNISLTLENVGADNEYYFFSTLNQKLTKPATQLGGQNVASTCYFNQTTFQGYLYTKMPKTYPSHSTNTTSMGGDFQPWPYAVKVEQVAAGGADVPTCVGPDGQVLGNFAVDDGTKLCDCWYMNTGTL